MADMMVNKLDIPSLFKKTDLGSALPEITLGCEWAMGEHSLMTVKLDGITIKVDWDSTKVAWALTQMHSNGMADLPLSRGYVEDKYIWQAFDNQFVKQPGIYICYGADINNNPHNLLKTFLLRMLPISHELLVQKHKTIVMRGPTTTVEEFYDSIRRELLESPEIEGLVFHLEDFRLNTVSMCKVKRQDFGMQWPIKVDPLNTQRLITNGYAQV